MKNKWGFQAWDVSDSDDKAQTYWYPSASIRNDAALGFLLSQKTVRFCVRS